MIKVKICGITNQDDALASVDAGCDALGFLFYKRSPRAITPEEAAKIIKKLPKQVIKIGVFVNEKEGTVRRISNLCKLDILQFHGEESAEYCRKFEGYKIIKVFRIRNKMDLKRVMKYKVFAYLFDTFIKGKKGGTGKQFNWSMVSHLEGVKCPIFLSGGLTEDNVKKAIKTVHPQWVDASSSLECRPGIKDHKRVKRFVEKAKKTTK